MRRILCYSFTILALLAARYAFAETSTVEAVRLYPDGARILRTAEVGVAAGQSLVEIEVPANLSWRTDTLQVNVAADAEIDILGVQSRTLDPSETTSPLQERIDELADQIGALKTEVSTAEGLAKSLRGMIERSTLADVDAADMLALFTEAQRGIADLQAQALAGKKQIETLDEERNRLIRQLRERGEGQPTRIVELSLDAGASTDALFTLTYLTGNANWSPTYETNLTSEGDEAALTIVQNAQILQQTGESWDDVDVVLSTARAFANTQMPELDPWFLYAQQLNRAKILASGGIAYEDSIAMAAPAMEVSEAGFANFATDIAPMEAPTSRGSVSMAGLFAEIRLEGSQDLEPGVEPTQVRLQTTPLTVDLSRRTTPVLDETVYLFAEFQNDTGAALLPGQATLFHNGRFAGLGYLPPLQPGETAEMGFGPDERITVSRQLLDRSSGDRGLFRGKRRIERDYAITLNSYHDAPIAVQVFDQLPVAEDEDVSISLLETSSRPAAVDYNDKKGVIQWVGTLEPAKESVIRFGFEVLQPADRPVPFLR